MATLSIKASISFAFSLVAISFDNLKKSDLTCPKSFFSTSLL